MRVAWLRVMPEERWRSMDVYAHWLTRSLRALGTDIDFLEVTVHAWTWADRRVPMPYGRAASLHTLGLYLSRWIRYPLALRRVQADIYHVLDNSYGHLAFFLPPARTVVTMHGGTPRGYRQWQPKGPAMFLFDLAYRGMLRAGHIISVSEHSKRELLNEATYPEDAIHVVHNGVAPTFRPSTPQERQRLRSQLLSSSEAYLILHVGHSAARKNVTALYQALALLHDRGRAVRLLRIGGLPTPAQEALIEHLKISAAITHLPHIDNQELPAYYAAADVFAFPSLYEGFGIPLIEAMACGAPVVCNDSALFREVCAEAALYVDARQPEALADAIDQILNAPALANELRARGLARARQFTWERTARQTLAVYRMMM